MSFLNQNNEQISARLTQTGRRAIAKGNFNISYFAIGDSEFVYSGFTGTAQSVFAPLDNDNGIKYPISYDSGSTSFFGIPVTGNTSEVVTNQMGSAGIFSGLTLNTGVTTGSISLSSLSSVSAITVNVNSSFSYRDAKYITLAFSDTFNNRTITGYTNSLTYKLLNVVTTTGSTEILTLDRATPYLTGLTGNAKIIANDARIEFPSGSYSATCLPAIPDPSSAHDPWDLNVVWSKLPIGITGTTNPKDYISSTNISTKEFLGYHSNAGQYFTNYTGGTITGTTYVNSFGNEIEVLPSEQNAIAILHYSKAGDFINDPDRFYKFDDYLSADSGFTEVYIPYIDYHRNTGTTIGAKFKITGSTKDVKYVTSKFNSSSFKLRYKDLLDEQNLKVGKVFLDKKVIVFDDQEIVATLDYKSNRRYTLPTPKLESSHSSDGTYLMDGSTGQTLYVSYVLANTNDINFNALPLNNFAKYTTTIATSGTCTTILGPTNVAVKFSGATSFDFLQSNVGDNLKNGIAANKFYILAQITTNNSLPTSNNWKKIDKTPTLNGNGYIDKASLTGATFTLSYNDYYSATPFALSDQTSQFGDKQPFAGGVKVTRESTLEELNFLAVLPLGQFTYSKNPTFVSGNPVITEISLLNGNKDTMVIGKMSSPITRLNAQVLSVRLDF